MKSRTFKITTSLTAGAIALLSGAFAHADGFDVDDLNIMFSTSQPTDGAIADPVTGQALPAGSLFPNISIIAPLPGATKTLISPTLFQDVETNATAVGIGTPPQSPAEQASVTTPGANFHVGSDIRNWRIESLRYDSCFPAVSNTAPTSTAGCIEHVRLIAQPVSGKLPTGEDTTMHLLFAVDSVPVANQPLTVRQGVTATAADLTNTDRPLGFLKMIKDTMAAAPFNINTNGKPLGEHPAFLSGNPAARAKMAQLASQFIAKFCSFDKLMVITYMGLEGRGAQPWVWFGGDANTVIAGHWKVAPQPTMGTKIRFNNLGTEDATGGAGHVQLHPVRNAKDGAGQPVDSATISMLFDTPKAQQTSIEKSVLDQTNRLENPRLHRPDNTDCFSCHATNTQMRVTVKNAAGANVLKGAFVGMNGFNLGNALAAQDEVGEKAGTAAPTNTTFVVADGVTAYIDNASQPPNAWNVRNFGREGGKVSVSYLAAQSAGDVVNFTNTVILHLAKNPGVTCGSPQKQMALRNCTLFGAVQPPFTAGAPALTFDQCKAAAQCQ